MGEKTILKSLKYPLVNYNGSNCYIVACCFCKSSSWEIAFNPKKNKFIGKCKTCYHVVEITPDNLRRKPIVRTFLGGWSEPVKKENPLNKYANKKIKKPTVMVIKPFKRRK